MKIKSISYSAILFFVITFASCYSGEIVNNIHELNSKIKSASPGDTIVMQNGV